MSAPRWLNRTVPGIGLASLFSDLSHEIATTLMAAFPVATDAMREAHQRLLCSIT